MVISETSISSEWTERLRIWDLKGAIPLPKWAGAVYKKGHSAKLRARSAKTLRVRAHERVENVANMFEHVPK